MKVATRYVKHALYTCTILTTALIYDAGYHSQSYAQEAEISEHSSGNTKRRLEKGTIAIRGSLPGVKTKFLKIRSGKRLLIQAPRAPRGKIFSHWEGSGVDLLSDPKKASQTIDVNPDVKGWLLPRYIQAPLIDGVPTIVEIRVGKLETVHAKPGQRFTLVAPRTLKNRVFKYWRSNTKLLSDVTKNKQTFIVPNYNVRFFPIFEVPDSVSDSEQKPVEHPETATHPERSVRILSAKNSDTVVRQGTTLVGEVISPEPNMTVKVRVGSRSTTVDVEERTGKFLVRLDEAELKRDTVSVRFTPQTTTGSQPEDRFTFRVTDSEVSITNLLSRVTFGATPSLVEYFSNGNPKNRFREYIKQQLLPETVDDSAFLATNPDRHLKSNSSRKLRKHYDSWRFKYSIYSQRQLLEVMTQFWDNHFISSSPANLSFAHYDELLGFREHALGSFRELLRVSSQSPIMMLYLDNAFSHAGNINENYARELLELHTVGVDGGYGPKDIIEVAKIMTGWSVTGERKDGRNGKGFAFKKDKHDDTDKYIPFLDVTIKGRSGANGIKEGEELLDILANHPSTQRFICGKLIQRFLSDAMPANFMDACVTAWQRSNGNIGKVVEAILLHPEFMKNTSLQGNKVKTPYEYVTGMVRNFGIYPAGDWHSIRERKFFKELHLNMQKAGHRWDGTPDGVSEKAEDWISTGSMLSNYNGMIEMIRGEKTGNSYEDNWLSDIDFNLFLRNAEVKTAEGVAAYMLDIATAGRFKSDELETVAAAMKGSDNIFEPNDDSSVNGDIRRAMMTVLIMPNTIIQ